MSTTLVFLALLAYVPSEKYESGEAFLKAEHTTLKKLCHKHGAQSCVLKKEPVVVKDEMGFSVETGTMEWVLYREQKQ